MITPHLFINSTIHAGTFPSFFAVMFDSLSNALCSTTATEPCRSHRSLCSAIGLWKGGFWNVVGCTCLPLIADCTYIDASFPSPLCTSPSCQVYGDVPCV